MSRDRGAENKEIFPSDNDGSVGPIPPWKVSSSHGIKTLSNPVNEQCVNWRPAVFPNDLKCPGINSITVNFKLWNQSLDYYFISGKDFSSLSVKILLLYVVKDLFKKGTYKFSYDYKL